MRARADSNKAEVRGPGLDGNGSAQLKEQSPNIEPPSRAQELSELTGALAFMAAWHERITARVELDGDISVSDLYDVVRDAAAWLRAAKAFEKWRATA